jgi:hypothetical protein
MTLPPIEVGARRIHGLTQAPRRSIDADALEFEQAVVTTKRSAPSVVLEGLREEGEFERSVATMK